VNATPPTLDALLALLDRYRIDSTLSVAEHDGVTHPWGYCPHVTNHEGYLTRDTTIRQAPLRDALTDIYCPACRNVFANGPDWLHEYLHPVVVIDQYLAGIVDAATARALVGPTPMINSPDIARLLTLLPDPGPLQPGPVQYVTRPLVTLDDPALAYFAGGVHRADGLSIVNGVAASPRAIPLGDLPTGIDGTAAVDIFTTLLRESGMLYPAAAWDTACRLAG
jgi:hypothetical protein